MESTQSNSIQWKQMASLNALYASVIIGWIAYHRYQPVLLEKFELTQYAALLVWVQAIILVVTPPIAGKLGDMYRDRLGNRLRIITLGVSFAAMIFMTVAFTLIINPPKEFLLYALPILIALWLFAMSLFTSPAISMVELFSPTKSLPITVATLTITSDLLYSLEPVIVDIIDYLGGAVTFAIGGMIVSLSGYFLHKVSMDKMKDKEEERPDDKQPNSNLGLVLLIGSGIGLVSGIVIEIFPEYLNVLEGTIGLSGKWLVSILLVITAIFSLPASKFVQGKNLGNQLLLFLALAAVALAGVFMIDNKLIMIALLIAFAVFYSFINVCSLPFALRNTSIKNKVFGVGVFFCGFEIPNGIIDILTT
jgi:MFS family permease